MTSNNKLFKRYLYKQSNKLGTTLKDTDFIIKSREEWKSMSQNDKNKYAKKPQKGSVCPEMPPIDPKVILEAKRLRDEIENKLIDSLVLYKTKEEVMETKFYLMSTNIQCVVCHDFKKAIYEWRPLEIGIIEYTLKDGILRNYHQFIDCGDVPNGYAFRAMDHKNRTHKIPLKDFFISSNNYHLIGSRVLEILSESCPEESAKQIFNNPMIVFSKSEQIIQSQESLKWIENKYKEMDGKDSNKSVNEFNIKVLDVSKLLSTLLMAREECRPLRWCENAITSHAFDYAIGTDCAFHEKIDCVDCALGVPKRMAYLMSHFLRKSYDIRLKATHIPAVKAFENLKIKEDDENEYKPKTKFVLQEEEDRQLIEQMKKNEEQTDEWTSNETNSSVEDNQIFARKPFCRHRATHFRQYRSVRKESKRGLNKSDLTEFNYS